MYRETSVNLPKSLYDYLGTLGTPLQNLNRKMIVREACNYCKTLEPVELENRMKQKIAEYYKLFIKRHKIKLVHAPIPTTEDLSDSIASNVITLYILIFLEDLADQLNISEENRFNA